MRLIVEGTATETGDRFFEALVKNIAVGLNVRAAWVTEYLNPTRQLRVMAFWNDGECQPPFEISIEATPCEKVITSADLVHYPQNISQLFPDSAWLQTFKAVSYMGMPLISNDDEVIGSLAVIDIKPLIKTDRAQAIFKIFAARAAAELQHMRSVAEIRRREEKYRRIVETTSEGFLMLDEKLRITDINEAFSRLVGYDAGEIIGKELLDFVPNDLRRFIMTKRGPLYEGRLREFNMEIVNRDGHRIPVVVYGNTLKGDHGEMLGYMNFIVDMTRHKRSLTIAGKVQKALLPQGKPQIDGFDIAWRTVSCDEVGGDYFDFLRMSDCAHDDFSIAVGDVSGHGVDAALIMASARSLLRMRAAQCGTPAEIINEMNLHFSRDLKPTGIFMTLFFMRLYKATGVLQWIRAGHLPALIYTPDADRFTLLRGRGIALGIDPHFSYQAYHTPLAFGQIVVAGTDGIVETRSPQGELFGRHRLQTVIRTRSADTADAIVAAVMDALDNFAAGMRREDDVTLLILKVDDIFQRTLDWQI